MKPVYQVPLDGECVRNSIASVLELPKEKVPTFQCEGHKYDADKGQFICTIPEHVSKHDPNRFNCDSAFDQRKRINDWLEQFGLIISDMWMGYDSREGGGPREGKRLPPGFCLASGKSPRGPWNHMVVWDTRLQDYEHPIGQMVHDPNPDPDGKRPGLVGLLESMSFLEVVDPSKLRNLAALYES